MDRFASMHDEDIDKLGIKNQVGHRLGLIRQIAPRFSFRVQHGASTTSACCTAAFCCTADNWEDKSYRRKITPLVYCPAARMVSQPRHSGGSAAKGWCWKGLVTREFSEHFKHFSIVCDDCLSSLLSRIIS